jgi:hypothetical protein
MAEAAGVYGVVWRPEENGIEKAGQLIEPLWKAIKAMTADPERFKQFNPKNGWGDYWCLLAFLREVLAACEDAPDAEVNASR